MEALQVLAKGGVAIDAYRRLLGPSFDYLGQVLRNRTEATVESLRDILNNAKWKLGDEIEEEGSVPPRIVKDVLEEGAYFESEIASEYFGGIVAASRSKNGKDDRGSTFTKLLGRLSTYHISTHYFLYSVIRELYSPAEENLSDKQGRNKLETFSPLFLLIKTLRIGDLDESKQRSILDHSLFGLVRENLISNFKYGPMDELRVNYDLDIPGITFKPSASGIDLFLWAHGHGDKGLNSLLGSSIEFKSNVDIYYNHNINAVNEKSWPKDKDFRIGE